MLRAAAFPDAPAVKREGPRNRRSVAGLVATAERSHVLERLNIKLAIPRQCEMNLLGQRRRIGSYYE